MLLALFMVFGVGTAMAQQYAADADQSGDGVFESTLDVPLGQTFCFDAYLEDAAALATNATSGGLWVAFGSSTSVVSYVSAGRALNNGAEGPTGPWDPAAGGITNEANGVGTLQIVVGQPAGAAPDVNGDIIVAEVCMQCDAPGDANIRLRTIPGFSTWGPNPPYVDGDITTASPNPTLVVSQICECTTDTECQDDLYCNGDGETCVDCACLPGTGDPCDDGDVCTIDACDEDTDSCLPAECDQSQLGGGATSPCCQPGEACEEDPICGAEVTLIKQSGYYQPPSDGDDCTQVVTIKNKVCLNNPEVLVGGIQFDLCDSPDCLECIACELTERTVMFDCVVSELPNGCCRVIMFCKNPGCAINPGLCDIATIVQQTKCPYPEECNACIEEDFVNIVADDYNGFPLATGSIGGTLCPVVCGDICPPGDGVSQVGCGNGIVDIYDIMCEVNLALAADCSVPFAEPAYGGADPCQQLRADVPTGTPPICADPDGCVNISDVMVLIDSALNRQDCCSFYYLGIIY